MSRRSPSPFENAPNPPGIAMPNCIDLKTTFGRRYRIGTDPAAGPRNCDPWLWTVRCRHGHMFPWGGSRLAAWTKRRGPIANRLKSLPCVEVVQDGADGVTVTFDVTQFDQVAAVMQPRRRRKLNPDQRAACAARLAKLRETSQGPRQSDCGELGTHRMPGVVSLDVPAVGSLFSPAREH